MKKLLSLVLALSLLLSLCACGLLSREEEQNSENRERIEKIKDNADETLDGEAEEAADVATDSEAEEETEVLVEDDEKQTEEVQLPQSGDGMYAKLMKFDACTDAEQMKKLLSDLYQEPVEYLTLKYDESTGSYEEPYGEIVAQIKEAGRNDRILTTDTYFFFLPYQESPVFFLNEAGAYFVIGYDYLDKGDEAVGPIVTGCLVSALYDGEIVAGEYFEDDYLEFEELVRDFSVAP